MRLWIATAFVASAAAICPRAAAQGGTPPAGAPGPLIIEEPRAPTVVEAHPMFDASAPKATREAVDVHVTVTSPPDDPPPSANTDPSAGGDDPDETTQQKKGTHFFAELQGGGSVYGGFGGAGGLLLGAGGKLVGFPWVFYLVGELGYVTAHNEGSLQSSGEAFRESRRYLDTALGLRVYVPLVGPIRFFADALAGGTRARADLDRAEHRSLRTEQWQPFALVGAGFQVRFLHHLSAGIRLAWRFTDDPLAELRDSIGAAGSDPMTVTGSLTWHF